MKNYLLKLDTRKIGYNLSKFGLVLILLWLGIFKFTPTEANGIKPLIEHSPFFSWQLSFLSIRSVSGIIGAVEIAIAIMILLEFKFKRLAQFGYLIGTVMFISTISFLFTTPGTFKTVDGVPITEFFILKDFMLLGFCVYKLNFKLLLIENK